MYTPSTATLVNKLIIAKSLPLKPSWHSKHSFAAMYWKIDIVLQD